MELAIRCILVTVMLQVASMSIQAATSEARPVANRPAEPSYTRDRIFSIPFYVNAKAQAPDQIVLYASGDQGRKWKAYQSRRPGENRFDFRTASDGEFWFVVRSSQDQRPPNETTPPEKIVIVDQTPPEMDLKVTRENQSGQFQARWEVMDENLDPTSFSLEYRMPGEETWRPVTVDLPRKGDFVGSQWSGTVSWVAGTTTEAIDVKTEVKDRAGNRRDLVQSVGQDSNDPEVAATPMAPITSTSARNDQDRANEVSWREESRPDTIRSVSSSTSQVQTSSTRSTSSSTTDASSGFSSSTDSGSEASRPALPSPADVQLTNSKKVELEYDVQATGTAGVSRVELWMTSDEGLTWRDYATDSDLKSPISVELPGEGNYGFRLLIHDQHGRSAAPPQAGDRADLWIGLDNTPPQIRLTSAETQETEQGTELQLTWAASDANLGDGPISVLYNPTKRGRWYVLYKDLPNTGKYQGILKLPLPPNCFLRIEAVDKAGNRASDEMDEPLRSGSQPQGVIRGFHPVASPPTVPEPVRQ